MEQFLSQYSEWIRHATLWSWIGQNIMWVITKFLYMLSAACESLVSSVFSVFGFLDYPVINNIYTGFQRVAFAILVLMLIVLGLSMVFGKKIKFKDVGVRIIIYACVLVQLPAVMNWGLEVAQTMFEDSNQLVTGDMNSEDSISFNIIRANTADMTFVAYNGFDLLTSGEPKNGLSEATFSQIDLAEILTPDMVDDLQGSSSNEDVENLKYYLTVGGEGSDLEATEIKNGWFSIFDEGTFRFAGNFKVMIVSFLILILYNLLLFSKLIFIMIDLIFQKLAFPIVVFTDLQTGERAKRALEGLLTGLLTIGFLGISRALFVIYYTFIGTLDFNFLGFGLLGLVGAIAFLRGSDSLARMFGIDTSMKDGLLTAGALYGGYRMGKAGLEAMKGGAEKAKEVAPKIPEQARKSAQATQEAAVAAAGSAGQVAGHLSERGVGGFVADRIQTSVGNAKEKLSAMGGKGQQAFEDNVQEPLSTVKKSFNEGTAAGVQHGMAARKKAEQMPAEAPEQPSVRFTQGTPESHQGKPAEGQTATDQKGSAQEPSLSASETGNGATRSTVPSDGKQPEKAPGSPTQQGVEASVSTTPGQANGESTSPTPPIPEPVKKAPGSTGESVQETVSTATPAPSQSTPTASSTSESQKVKGERNITQEMSERITTSTTAANSSDSKPVTVPTQEKHHVSTERTTTVNQSDRVETTVSGGNVTGNSGNRMNVPQQTKERHTVENSVLVEYQNQLNEETSQQQSDYSHVFKEFQSKSTPKKES